MRRAATWLLALAFELLGISAYELEDGHRVLCAALACVAIVLLVCIAAWVVLEGLR